MKLLVWIFVLLLVGTPRLWGVEVLSLASGEFHPLSGKKLPEGGLATSIVSKACEAVGWKPEIAYMPWARGYLETLHQRYTATYPYTRTEERAKEFLFSKPLYSFRISVFVTAQSKVKFESLDDLKGLRLALPVGFAMFSLAPMVERKEISMVRTTDMKAAIKMLEYNRSDIIVIMDSIGWTQIEKIYGHRRGFRMLEKPLERTSDHLIVSKMHPKGQAIIDRFNEGLEILKKSGELDRMVSRLGEAYYQEPSHEP